MTAHYTAHTLHNEHIKNKSRKSVE